MMACKRFEISENGDGKAALFLDLTKTLGNPIVVTDTPNSSIRIYDFNDTAVAIDCFRGFLDGGHVIGKIDDVSLVTRQLGLEKYVVEERR